MHEQTVTEAFTRQADSFNRSPVANATEMLDQILELARPAAGQRWLELACGPGIITRRLAPLVASVHGVDATRAMIELAEREAGREQLENVSFSQGDATALSMPPDSYDGIVSRFSLHHIPVPGRVFEEAARVARPGSRVVIVDHLADPDAESFAWTQEVERLRDPSHWASLTADRLREFGHGVGLQLEAERTNAMDLDFAAWLERGEAGPEPARLVERLVAERPGGTPCFELHAGPEGARVLRLQIWMSAWRKPERISV